MRAYREEDLGKVPVPAEYGKPDFSVEDPVNPGPTPDANLAADTAKAMASGDPNPGFSLGGADDPLKEMEPAKTDMTGKPAEISKPTFGMSSVEGEDTVEDPIYEYCEDEGEFEDGDEVEFDSVDEMPEFEEYDDVDMADATVDGAGIIEPEIVNVDLEDPELGAVPDVELPMTEPIVQVEPDEPDVYATESEIEGGDPEPIFVSESFRLPEDRSIVVAKGDQIFVVGHAMNERTPKFTESAFKRAFRSLVESKNTTGKIAFKKSEGLKRCALVGRSLLVEVAKDWRIPGTDLVLEAHDIIQIVSMKPVTEKTLSEGGKGSGSLDNFGDKKAAPFKKEETEEEKAKKEYYLARKRYMEAKARREAAGCEDCKKECGDSKTEEDDDDKKKVESFLRKHGIK